MRRNIRNQAFKFFEKRGPWTVVSKPSFTLTKMKRITFYSQTKELIKKERCLNLNNFNNKSAITKIRFSSHNFATNITKWYNHQEDIKICKNCEKKVTKN